MKFTLVNQQAILTEKNVPDSSSNLYFSSLPTFYKFMTVFDFVFKRFEKKYLSRVPGCFQRQRFELSFGVFKSSNLMFDNF